MPSGGYVLTIHRYPILCCGVHVSVVTIYVMVKAACFTTYKGRMYICASVYPDCVGSVDDDFEGDFEGEFESGRSNGRGEGDCSHDF